MPKLRRKNPEADAAKKAAAEAADDERRRKNICCCDESFCGGVRCSNRHPWKQLESPKPFIASPLQKETWQAQSEKFARQRCEIVEPKPAPVVESKRRDIAYQLSLDGFTFFEDGEPCPIPLPPGIPITGASMPSGYRSGSCQIPSGLRWDAIQFVWIQK